MICKITNQIILLIARIFFSCVHLDYVTNGMNAVIRNFVNTKVQFRFNSFYWSHVGIEKSRIYIHCLFQICSKNLSSSCNVDVSIVRFNIDSNLMVKVSLF